MEMEIVLGNGEETRAKASSSEIGSGTQHDSGEKTLIDDEVRVSENGKKKLFVSDDDKKSKENVIEKDSGVIDDCEMNGVSCLLKLKQDCIDKDKNLQRENETDEDDDDDGDDDDGDDGDDDDDEDDEDEDHGFQVGDFVWGKIKNHPWWPGQIYDPSDASDLALKIKQKGKLLVAYFGDGTFAWCDSSQLKPFAESFKECSKISNSRGFIGAVEEAVEEMGRHIERLLICDCAGEKHKFDDNQEAKNGGIKEGVFVRDVRREMISSLLVGKPGEIVKDVKGFAETVSFGDLLELEVLKRKISAFYRSKRGYGLIEYHEPQSVPGLEDKNKDDEDEDIDAGVNWWRGGAKRSSKVEEEEEADKEEVLDPEESLKRSLEKCSGFPDNRLHHRRKEKSIAEILENETYAKVRFETEPVDGNIKSGKKKVKSFTTGELENVTTANPRRRRMSKVSTIEDDGHKRVEENGKGQTLTKNVDDNVDVASGGKEESVHAEEIDKTEVSDLKIDIDSTPLASLLKRVKVDASSVEKNIGNSETSTQTTKRERKKSKYFSPDYLSDFSWKGRKKSKTESESSKVSSENKVGEQMIDLTDTLMAVKDDNLNVLGHQELTEEVSNAIDFLRLGATPKEMRDLIRLSALGTQYPKDSSSRDMVREFMSIYRSFTYHDGVNNKFLASYDSSDKEKEELNEPVKPETKGTERKDKKRKAKQQAEEIEQIGNEEKETDKHETTKKEPKLKKPKSKKQEDDEEETVKESSEKAKSKQQEDEEEVEKIRKERKVKKAKSEEEETQKKKREGKSQKKETEKEFCGAELFVTFGPNSNLPKKEDLIEIYEKFGALKEERTSMFYNNFSACVAFLNIADGEKAFESSQEKCPFVTTSTVKFRLKYPNEKTEEKKAETQAEVAETTMEIDYVKMKLEEMISLVDECEGGMSEEVKVKLEDEMVNLVEKVKMMRSS